MKFILGLFFSMIILVSNAQNFKVKIIKEKLVRNFDGYGLKFIILNKNVLDTISPGDYEKLYVFSNSLSKDEKVLFAQELSAYFNDYSLCAYKIRLFIPYAGVFGSFAKGIEKSSLAIESMYITNMILFGDWTRFLSNSPVLVEKYSGKIVSYNDSLSISKLSNLYCNLLENLNSHELSLIDLMDLYRGPVGWFDAEYIPNSRRIVADLYREMEADKKRNKNKEKPENKKNVFERN